MYKNYAFTGTIRNVRQDRTERGENMKEEWLVFTDQNTGRELCAYTTRGTFPGELEATRELTAHENGIPAEQISTRKEMR